VNNVLERLRNVCHLSFMNKLPIEKRVQIMNLLVEGSSLRATSRIADVSINTVTKLLVDVGNCGKFHNEIVQKVASKRVPCDEIWSFAYAKQKNVREGMGDYAGGVCAWTALDADSKLIVSWYVGQRNLDSVDELMTDGAARLANGVQLTSDGHRAYLQAVEVAFEGEIDFSRLRKIYNNPEVLGNERRYSPAECTVAEKHIVEGCPDEKHISTSYVERQNLTIRMHIRRFTRLANAFPKKIENHCYAVALYFVYYNFVKIHKTLRLPPAMKA